MQRLDLSERDICEVNELLDEVVSRFNSVEESKFLRRAPVLAHDLPERVRSFLNDFRLFEPAGVAVVSGYPVDDEALGPTPAHWAYTSKSESVRRAEAWFALCGSLLGDLFGWATQQDGRIMHDVLPIRGHEREQLGSGSEVPLTWHTEDAFHPFRGDYVALMCLRNPDAIGTLVAEADCIEWVSQDTDVLFSPCYHIRPDESHLPKNRVAATTGGDDQARLLQAAYERIVRMQEHPEGVAVLSGDRTSPYICLDPYFMDVDSLEPPAKAALTGLMDAIDDELKPLVVGPGDCCFIDNLRAVHGRGSFKARFDGTDRWLKRLNITRNLRTSRAARLSGGDRVVY